MCGTVVFVCVKGRRTREQRDKREGGREGGRGSWEQLHGNIRSVVFKQTLTRMAWDLMMHNINSATKRATLSPISLWSAAQNNRKMLTSY